VTWGVRQRFGRYMALESPLHGLDPAAKLVVFGLLVASVLICGSWLQLVAAACYVAVLCAVSGVRVRFYFDSLRYFSWMFALSFAINLVFPRGEGTARLSYHALSVAGVFSVRLVLMILAATLLTVVASPSEIGDSLLLLARPRGRIGRRAAEFATLVSIALRFVPVMFEEAERIRAAQRLRGQPSTGLRNRITSVVTLIVPLLESALRRSVSLGYALEARCYGYRLPQSPGVRVGINEIIFGSCGIGVLVVLIFMR
jgi:energy-coupling factor transport system permease protein